MDYDLSRGEEGSKGEVPIRIRGEDKRGVNGVQTSKRRVFKATEKTDHGEQMLLPFVSL